MALVRMPDGSMVDSTELDARPMAELTPLAQAAPAAAPAATPSPQLASPIQAGVGEGGLIGAGTVLGLPGTVNQLVNDFVNWGSRTMGWGDPNLQTPLPTGPELVNLWHEFVGTRSPTDEELGLSGRLARDVTSYTPGLMIPFGGSTAAAARTAAGTPAVARAGTREAGELAGAAAGAESARQLGFGDSPIGQLVAELVGALTGRGVAGGVSDVAEAGVRRVTQGPAAPPPVSGVPQDAVEQAALVLREQAVEGGSSPETLARQIDTALAAREAEGIRSPATTAQLTDSPGMQLVETVSRGRRSPAYLAMEDTARREAGDLVSSVRPAGAATGDLRLVAEADADVLANAQRGAEQASSDLAAAQAARARTPMLTDVPVRPAAASEVVDTGVRAARDVLRDERERLYGAIDPAGNRALQTQPGPRQAPPGAVVLNPGGSAQPIPLAATASRLVQTLRGLSGAVADQWRPVADEVDAYLQQGFVPIEALRELNQRLSGMMTAARQEPSGRVQQRLTELKDAITDTYGQLPALSGGSAEAAATADAASRARQFYQDEFAPRFREGVGGDINRELREQRARPPSETAGRFLQPNAPEKAEQLASILTRSPTRAAAEQGVEDYLVGDLLRMAQRTGRESLNLAQLTNWRNQFGDALDQFPAVRARVDDLMAQARDAEVTVGQAENTLSRAQENVRRVEQLLKDDPTQVFRDRDTALDGVRAIMASRNPVTQMRRVVDRIRGFGQAEDELKAAVSDFLSQRVRRAQPLDETEDVVSYAKMSDALRRYDPVLRQVYSPEEMEALNRARNIVRTLAQGRGQVTAGSPTYERQAAEQAMTAVELMVRAKFGILKGGGIMRMGRNLARAIQDMTPGVQDFDTSVKLVLDRAMMDPEVAARLLRIEVKPDDLAGLSRGPRAAGTAAGAMALEEEVGASP